MRIVGILLAAGQGRRFGGDKLLATLADGSAVGVCSARNLLAAIDEVVAVTRPQDLGLAASLRAVGVSVEPCPRAHEGMGASLAHAVRARRDADAWVVALADMPQIRPETIPAVRGALEQGAELVATSYRGERGHPVGFGACFGQALCALTGDAGARDILRAERSRMQLIEVDDPGVLADIDTPQQLHEVNAQQ